jgi:hypothetical protein
VKEDTTVLYRPVGKKEFELIARSGFRSFPPRLQGQPIFYPVSNEEYATYIARDWNTKDAASGFTGSRGYQPVVVTAPLPSRLGISKRCSGERKTAS